MNYEAWRITFQSAEHAAQTAFADVQRLHAEVAELRGALYDEHHGISFHARDTELQRMTATEAAARSLVSQKDRHHTEIAYRRLEEALTPNVELSGGAQESAKSAAGSPSARTQGSAS